MTRARDFANVISGQFDLPVGALDNVPAADLVNDTTPQLGGNLDGQTNNIINVGSVGVGTNSPATDLEVEANTTNGLVRLGQLQFKNSSGNHTQNTDGVHIFPFTDGNMYHDNYDGGFVYRTGAAVERMRVDSNGISLPSGSGINFSATADTSATGATTASELLDDYEEGTWTPTVGQGTVTTDHCTYTKIGNAVHVRGRIFSFSNRTSSGGVTISGLPFASSSDNRASQGILARYVNSGGDAIVAYVGPSSSDLLLFTTNQNSGYTTVTHNKLSSSSSLFFVNISYKAA